MTMTDAPTKHDTNATRKNYMMVGPIFISRSRGKQTDEGETEQMHGCRGNSTNA